MCTWLYVLHRHADAHESQKKRLDPLDLNLLYVNRAVVISRPMWFWESNFSLKERHIFLTAESSFKPLIFFILSLNTYVWKCGPYIVGVLRMWQVFLVTKAPPPLFEAESLYSPRWPGTYFVDQVCCLELTAISLLLLLKHWD